MVMLVKPSGLVSEPFIKRFIYIMCSNGCRHVFNDFVQTGQVSELTV